MKFRPRTEMIGALLVALAGLFSGCQTGIHLADKTHATRSEDVDRSKVADSSIARQLIVAKVNGVEIRKNTLDDLMQRLPIIDQEQASASPQDIRKRALDQLILQELALQEAARQGLRVEALQVDKAMQKAIARLGHEEGFNEYLEKQHITAAEFRAELERYLLVQLVFSREVVAKTGVSDDEVLKEYELRKKEYVSPDKISIIDVVFFLNQNDQASVKKAEKILAKIKADKERNPRNVANNDNAFIIRDLAPLDKEREDFLYNEARKLKQDELSGVIKATDSLHIIKVTEYEPEKQMSFDEVKHVLAARLKAPAIKKRREEWEQELKKGAKIELIDSADMK